MTALSYVFALVTMLGVLIFVHEFGHFVVAKLCGVRVLKFSLGFGPTIGIGRYKLSWRPGETEYVIAWFPLGGFVKMHGENPDEEEGARTSEDAGRAFPEKPVWQRLAIVFAGPGMNLLLPVAIFAVMLGLGMPRPAPVVGMVEAGSPAARAGVQAGDRIVSVDGKPVRWWDDVDDAIRAHTSGALALDVVQDGRKRMLDVPVQSRSGIDAYGEVREVGWIGVGHERLRAVLGIPSAGAPAARAGLRSGDLVVAVNGRPVDGWADLAKRYAAAGGSVPLRFTVQRGAAEASLKHPAAKPAAAKDGSEATKLERTVPALGSLDALGVVPATALVVRVSPDSPAQHAGLEAGDLILTVDGRPVGSFASFAETVRSSEGKPLHLVYARHGERHEVVLRAQKQEVSSELGIPQPRYLIGVQAEAAAVPGAVTIDQERNPLRSIPHAVAMTAEVTQSFLIGFGKIVTGQVSRKQLAGPIGIAEIAHTALERGWRAYISTLILISINLGILNLLPIPVLDGGQATLLIVEGVKRSPVSLRTREVAQQIGLTLLVLLMGLAFWNDLSRYGAQLVNWIRRGAGL